LSLQHSSSFAAYFSVAHTTGVYAEVGQVVCAYKFSGRRSREADLQATIAVKILMNTILQCLSCPVKNLFSKV